jgi:hypothetical protein
VKFSGNLANKKTVSAVTASVALEKEDESESLTTSCSEDESAEMRQEASKSSDLNESMSEQNNEDILQVNCNSIIGELFKSKLGSGNKGSCIRVLIDSNENSASKPTSSNSITAEYKWLTPIEFESYCGKGNCRDWKKTIKVGGQPLLTLFESQVLICHAVSCCCAICNQNDSLVGPIRPFKTYRRRKKDEILAQNAYKKFLSLKPPTLFNHDNLTKLSGNLEELSRSSRISIRDENSKNFSPHSSSLISDNEPLDDYLELLEKDEEKRWNLLEQVLFNLCIEGYDRILFESSI